MQPDEKPPVKTVNTTFKVLDELSDAGYASVSELSDRLNMPTSTVHNHIVTLESKHLVTKQAGKYSLGARFLELGGQFRAKCELFNYGRSEIDELAKDTGEMTNLMIEEHGLGVLIYIARGEQAITFDSRAGQRYKLHTNSLGKAILSTYSHERIDEIINRHGLSAKTDSTITDRETLLEELDQVEKRGYAQDDQERIDGLRCVGAPVTIDGRTVGSISVSGPASRIKDERFNSELPEKVKRVADFISINIQYE